MNKGQAKSHLPAAENLLDFTPQPAVPWETQENGLIALKWPRVGNKYLQTLLLPRLKHPYMLIHLDGYGTSVWRQMDGRKTVGEIGASLREEFGDSVEPVFERLGLFINLLARRKFITLARIRTNPQ
ncbi:PqqD family protein [candidate division KSB1 bacterium]|nr:PqqD family protein [candidate division KSB1 bacterium]